MTKRGKRHKGLLSEKFNAIKTVKPQLKEPSRKKTPDELSRTQQQARQAHLHGMTKQARSHRNEKHRGSHVKDFS